PVWADFDGPGTRVAPHYTEGQARTFHDPFAALSPDGRFRLGPAGQLPADLPIERVNLRHSLLTQFDRTRRRLDRAPGSQAFDRFREMAFSLVTSNRMREALDIGREPLALRERYGLTLFGQACLAARRLVEAGSKFVTVFWDGYGQFSGCAWDTHANH